MTTPPLTAVVDVDVPPERAFATLTDGIADWWPLDTMGVFGDGTVAFDDDAIVEESPDGRQTTWGEVTAWEPPTHVAFTWHPGRDDGPVTTVDVTITPSTSVSTSVAGSGSGSGSGSTVTLVHGGWDDIENGPALREEYERGWVVVLAAFADAAATA